MAGAWWALHLVLELSDPPEPKTTVDRSRDHCNCEALPGVYFGHMESPRSTLLPKTPRVVPISAVDWDTPIPESSLDG